MEKIVISVDEIAQTTSAVDESSRPDAKLSPPIPWWAKACLSPLVLVLPILCLVTVLLRVAMRGLPPRSRFAWVSFFSTLLVISGILTSIAGVLAFTLTPTPSVVSQGLSELDSRAEFPVLPAEDELTAEEVSDQLKPLVTVITPVRRNWFSHIEGPSSVLGAGVLLQANADGYLIATARHVIDGEAGVAGVQHALVASTSGTWATAEVVARHQDLDLALLWLPRKAGKASFTLPVAKVEQVKGGETIFVIGHPQDLRFTLSTGIVSRKDQDSFQISAPVSPGNSGGPLFTGRGQLAGIVTSMVDKNHSPNAENLNFAVRADALLELTGWTFFGDGRRYLTAFEQSQHSDPR
jgi:S1-C subfamily serine protease